MGRDTFFHIDPDQFSSPDSNEKLISYGDAAEALLNNISFQEFVRSNTSDLYDRFLELNPRSDPGKVADVIHSQNILSELVSYLRELKQMRDALEIKIRGKEEEDGKDKEYQTEQERDRERILGISGDPEPQGYPGVGGWGGVD